MNIQEGLKRTAVLCILRHGNDFMLLKRFKEPNKDMYTPVGGKLDPYETPKNAALRETKEETGIIVADMRFCGILVESSPTAYNWTSFVYEAEINKITPPNCNEGILEWIAFTDILTIPTPKTDWYIYDYLLKKQPFILLAEFNTSLELIEMTEEITGTKIV